MSTKIFKIFKKKRTIKLYIIIICIDLSFSFLAKISLCKHIFYNSIYYIFLYKYLKNNLTPFLNWTFRIVNKPKEQEQDKVSSRNAI